VAVTAYSGILRRWDELEWEDFVGSKMAVLDIEGGGGATGDAVVLAIEYAPDFEIATHHHYCGHVEVILEGEIRVGEHWERAGDFRIIPANGSYGPIRSGPNGAKGLEFFPDRKAIPPTVDDPDATVTGDPKVLRERLIKLLKLDM
jgi:hypothetical protein